MNMNGKPDTQRIFAGIQYLVRGAAGDEERLSSVQDY